MELVDTRVWPEQLQRLARDFDGPERNQARGEFWMLLNLALAQRLRMLAGRYYRLDSDRIQDFASEKALELVGKLDRGLWNPLDSTAGELVSFLSTIARNALIDELRRAKRADLPSSELMEAMPGRNASHRNVAAHGVERDEFVSQLVACAERLMPQHRVVWLLRVLYEMSSKTIAEHPEVLRKAGHVDVILGRCREQIRKCMHAHGLDARELPPGTFAELWRRFRGGPVSPEVPHV